MPTSSTIRPIALRTSTRSSTTSTGRRSTTGCRSTRSRSKHRMTTTLLVAAGYVLGSMPWGYWLPWLVTHDDIRRHGSGNIGGTNVWRVYGWRLGLPVVLLDTLKGFAPALVATLTVSHLAGVLAGAAAMLGHWRPMFLRWQRGGKVVATCGGAFLGVAPVVGGIGAGVWIIVFLVFRYASLASIAAALSVPIAAVLLDRPLP